MLWAFAELCKHQPRIAMSIEEVGHLPRRVLSDTEALLVRIGLWGK